MNIKRKYLCMYFLYLYIKRNLNLIPVEFSDRNSICSLDLEYGSITLYKYERSKFFFSLKEFDNMVFYIHNDKYILDIVRMLARSIHKVDQYTISNIINKTSAVLVYPYDKDYDYRIQFIHNLFRKKVRSKKISKLSSVTYNNKTKLYEVVFKTKQYTFSNNRIYIKLYDNPEKHSGFNIVIYNDSAESAKNIMQLVNKMI